MSFLTFDDLQKTYPDGTKAVNGIGLSVEKGEFIVLLGPSGCGKTTTLRMIAGLEIPTGGRIQLDGQDVTRLRPSMRDVGFVFQFYALYPHLTVRENILFPLKNVGMSTQAREDTLRNASARLGLDNLLKRFPGQLSGGDQQRISLARAMVRKPRVYLMDEPLGTLDAHRRMAMREFIREQQLDLKVTTLYVTHDQEEALSLADRIVVMEGGTIRQVGPPAEVYDNPADLFVAHFVGSPGMNFIEGQVQHGGDQSFFTPQGTDQERIQLPRRCPDGTATLGIRPEFIRLDTQGPVRGKVVLDEYRGSCHNIHLETGFGKLVVRSQESGRQVVGASVRVAFDSEHTRIFDPRSEKRFL